MRLLRFRSRPVLFPSFAAKKPWLRLAGLLGVIGLLLVIACQKDKLPPETQEGKNTFGCKINGKNWVPTGTPGKPSGGMYPGVNGGFFQIGTDTTIYLYIRTYKGDESVQLFARNIVKPGRYNLDNLTETKPNALKPLNYGAVLFGSTEYVTTDKYTGFIDIAKADISTGIISGTFEFTAVNRTNPTQTIRVNKGRFDIKH